MSSSSDLESKKFFMFAAKCGSFRPAACLRPGVSPVGGSIMSRPVFGISLNWGFGFAVG